MKAKGLGKEKTIDAFVKKKLEKLARSDKSMKTLFELMFSERENVMFEKSEGVTVRKITYGQVRDNALVRAARLREKLGEHEENAVVGLKAESGSDWVELFWAITACNCRPLLLNSRLPHEVLEKTLLQMNAVAVVSDGTPFAVRTVMTSDVLPVGQPDEKNEFGDRLFVMSSGTSESVKVCAYGAEQLCSQISDSYYIIKKNNLIKKHYDGALKQLVVLPFYHVFGFIAVYVWFSFFSRTFVELRDLSPETVVRTVRRHKVTHIFAVPLFWERTFDKAMITIRAQGEKTARKFDKALALSLKLGGGLIGRIFRKAAFGQVRERLFGDSLCFAISGGGAIRGKTMEFFNGIGYRLVNGFGATEVGISSVELSGSMKRICSQSVGKPLPSYRYEISEEGTLLVSGEALAKTVFENGEKRASLERFDTRDLAKKDKGAYYILGRKDDDIIVPATGENVNPALIEGLFDVSGVKAVCVVPGKQNALPVLLASVGRFIPSPRAEQIKETLARIVEEQALRGMIGKIELIGEDLIKPDEFKLNRRRIAADYASGRLNIVSCGAKSEDGEWDTLSLTIRGVLAAALSVNADEISQKSDFFTDLGGTSLDYFAYAAALGREFSLPTQALVSANLRTIEDAARFIGSNQ